MQLIFFTFLITCLGLNSWVHAFTTIQTSTSAGVYTDYQKHQHFPIYHSWSIRGIYDEGLETSIEFFINNDFSNNQWTVFPTQAEVTAPLTFGFFKNARTESKIIFGRQLFIQGFDFALLDGLQMPMTWSESGGMMPLFGNLSSTDFDQTSQDQSQILGLVLWESISKVHLKSGFTGRDSNFTNQFVFGSAHVEFENLLWAPTVLTKGEWIPDGLKFNQSYSELLLRLTDSVDSRLAYSNFEPRAVKSLASEAFVYRLFAISPTETVNADMTWSMSDDVILRLGAENSYYSSSYKKEAAYRQDFSIDYRMNPGLWLSPSLTALNSYGGDIKNIGLKSTLELSHLTRLIGELDFAYFEKINQIKGWAQSLRGTYETHFWNRAKFGVGLDVERNHYFVFDTRAHLYVTNYL